MHCVSLLLMDGNTHDLRPKPYILNPGPGAGASVATHEASGACLIRVRHTAGPAAGAQPGAAMQSSIRQGWAEAGALQSGRCTRLAGFRV